MPRIGNPTVMWLIENFQYLSASPDQLIVRRRDSYEQITFGQVNVRSKQNENRQSDKNSLSAFSCDEHKVALSNPPCYRLRHNDRNAIYWKTRDS